MPSSHRTFLLLPLVHQVSSGDHDSGFTPTPLNINFRSDVLDLGFKKYNLNLYFLLFCHSAPSRGEEPPVDGGGRNFTRNDKEEKEEEEEEEGGASGRGDGGPPGLSPA